MSVDVAAMIMEPATIGPLLAGAGALLSSVAAVTMLVPAVSRKLLPLPKETRLADFLPFERMLSDKTTITTKRGDLVQIVKIAGAELQVTNENEHQGLFLARRTWLSQLAEKGARARVFTVRTAIAPDALQKHPNPHMASLAEKWETGFAQTSFLTDHYAVISVDKDVGRVGLDEAVSLTLNALQPFKPEILTASKGESPLKILGRLASPISRPNPSYKAGADISDQITADTVEFSDDKTGLITWNSGPQKRYQATIGIKTWGDLTEEQMLADLASLPFEYVIFHYVEPLNRARGTAAMDIQYRLARTGLMSETAQDQFATVSEIIAGGGEDTQCLCNYGLNIIVEADTEADLIKRVSRINAITAQFEVTTVREGAVAQPIWWSQFPTYDTLPRPWKLLAANTATLLAMQRNHKGSAKSVWGPSPVTVLKTATGSPYNFVFHDMSDPGNKEPLGHMLVIGPSGSGKTVTVSWLAMMAMRFPELRVFFFDRYFGTEVVTNLAGGNYVRFDDDACAMNPLQMELTPRNKDYLTNWFKQITDLTDEASSEEFGGALEMLETIPQEARNLKNIWNAAFSSDSPVRAKIRPWITDNQHGKVFCAPRDSMDLESRMTSFDFTTLLNDERTDNLGPAVVSYIMQKTMDVSVHQGHPALYFVDETAPLLRNDFFAAKFAAGLQEGRKLGQIFICAFQRPNALEETPHGQTILGQCATQIFFRNVKAKASDFAMFGLTAREMDFVLGKSHNHIPRAFLLRRMSETDGVESVIIDNDMSGLGAGLQTFASGNASVRLMRELAKKDPINFRRLYMEKMEEDRLAA